MNLEDDIFRKTTFVNNTDNELEEIKEEHDFELMFQRSYFHILDRMKKDLISTQIKANEL